MDRVHPGAYMAVHNAIMSGDLPPVGTLTCVSCKKPGAAEYHHYKGYDKVNYLSVVPMCRSCHTKEHRKGTRHKVYNSPTNAEIREAYGMPARRPSRLSSDDVLHIKLLRNVHKFRLGEIGKLFGISESMVCKIVSGDRH